MDISSSSQLLSPSVQDDVLWTEYLNLASSVDARLVKDWTKVIDVLLVFVALFSGILTAFIIRTLDNFQPQPTEVTNKILIAIYNRTMNASMPIDLEEFLRLDDTSRRINVYQSWLLYTSLTISILVAALAMAAKLWVVRYSREVATSGPPRARAKRRQEVYGGMLAWKLEYCIDAMPVMSLIAVILFALFIQSSTTTRQEPIAYFVDMVFETGIAFIAIVSSSAAFIFDSPYQSPFSDFINFVFRILPDKPILTSQVHWRTIGIPFTSVCGLAAAGYLAQKHDPFFLPCLYYGLLCVFALMQRGRYDDEMQPRLFNLPLLVFLSSIINFITFFASTSFVDHLNLWYLLFVVASILLYFSVAVTVKISKTRPNTVEAKAVSWFLKTSSNMDPAWFEKAVQIGRQYPYTRPLLIEKLLPLLSPLIVSLPEGGHENISPEQKRYIITLASLMEFEPKTRDFRRNEAAVELPTLPKDLIKRLKKIRASNSNHQESGTDACVIDAVNRIQRHHEPSMQEILESESGERV